MTQPPTSPPDGTKLPRNVVALSAVSFLTDVSSEMITPLLPAFVASLGGGAMFLGAIEGAADSVAALLKLASGWWSDRVARRKPLVVAGYALASVARPLIAFATVAGHVLLVRVVDRVGKGLRTAPRDALIADSTAPAIRGRAFGFHRAADHAGTVLGGLIAFALMSGAGLGMRDVFLWAAVPAALAVATLVVLVREPASTRLVEAPAGRGLGLPRRAWAFLIFVLLFTLGRSTEVFLLLRATELGLAPALVPLAWALAHVFKSAATAFGGALADRVGHARLVVIAWLLQAVAFLGLALAEAPGDSAAALLGAVAALGLAEGPERALVAEIAPTRRRGATFGAYNLALALGALPAALVFGATWDAYGATFAFSYAALLGVFAAAGVLALGPRRAGLTSSS